MHLLFFSFYIVVIVAVTERVVIAVVVVWMHMIHFCSLSISRNRLNIDFQAIVFWTDRRMDQQRTDLWTDGPMDQQIHKPSYTRTSLKTYTFIFTLISQAVSE